MLMQNFGMTNKEHYGMLWYFLEWLIILHSTKSFPVYCKHSFTYLVDFLKTNLMKFAVIWVKRCEKAGFLSPRSSKIIVTKGNERRKRKSEEKKRRTTEKSNGCTISFYNSYFKDSFWPEKKTVGITQNVQLARMFSNIRLRIYLPGVLKTGLAKK